MVIVCLFAQMRERLGGNGKMFPDGGKVAHGEGYFMWKRTWT